MNAIPAYQAWHCGSCDAELEEGDGGNWVCRAEGLRFDSRGRPVEDDEEEEGE
jgi:hypothetical protein